MADALKPLHQVKPLASPTIPNLTLCHYVAHESVEVYQGRKPAALWCYKHATGIWANSTRLDHKSTARLVSLDVSDGAGKLLRSIGSLECIWACWSCTGLALIDLICLVLPLACQ